MFLYLSSKPGKDQMEHVMEHVCVWTERFLPHSHLIVLVVNMSTFNILQLTHQVESQTSMPRGAETAGITCANLGGILEGICWRDVDDFQ